MAGTPHYRRELAGEVRDLTLKEIKKVLLNKKDKEGKVLYEKPFRQQVLLRLAGSVLPRLNEHTGADGEKLTLGFDGIFKATSKTKKNCSESKTF